MKKALWGVVVLGGLLLLALGFLIAVDLRSMKALPSTLYYRVPASPPGTWKVGVLGDSQKGLANLRNIAAAVSKERVDLLLHSGDLVSTNDEGHYRLAYAYLLEGIKDGGGRLPRVAPGNHDLKAGSERFIAWCGPLEQSFVKSEVAFVLLNNAFGNPPPDPKHVEERIAAAGPHQGVVLAMHQPPFDVEGQVKPEYAGFLAWLEKSKVDYLVCGHVHGYLRKKVGETTVIINGVGGDYDKWQLDQKVYATILDIDGSRITDRSIVLEPVHEVWENVEHLAIGHVAEAYRGHPIPCWGGTLLLVAGVVFAIRRIIAIREPLKPPPG